MHIKLLELVFIVVVVLGIGFWQLYAVNRALREHDEDGDEGSDQASSRSSDDDDPDPKANA